MKNHRFLLLAVLPVLAACAAQQPKAKPSAPPVAAAPAAAPKAAAPSAPSIPSSPSGTLAKVYGEVVSFDADTHKLVLKDKRGVSRTFIVAADAKLTKGGDEASIDLGDIKAGEHVALRCGGAVVASVHVKVTKSAGAVATGH